MKKYIYMLFFLLIGTTASRAQRMLPKQKGLEINSGILSDDRIGNDYYLNIGMIINGKNGNFQLWALEYTHQYHDYKMLRIPLETYTAEGGYSFFLLGDFGKNITLNAGITSVLGYEQVNRGKRILDDGAKILSQDNFIYGLGSRLSLETYLSDWLVLLIQGRVKALWGTDLNLFRPSAGAGLRINF